MENSSREAERQAFLFWMRTGRRLPITGAGPVERKFNPWHDPQDGRFTFGPGGARFHPVGGGWGGAGSSASWDGPGSAAPRPVRGRPDGTKDPRRGSASQRSSAVRSDAAHLEQLRRAAATAGLGRHAGRPNRIVERHTYRYELDSANRTRDVSGHLSSGPMSPRSRTAQARAGGADRRAGDDGGHYIARRFNGPSDAFNHFAQSARFNRGSYRALEDTWARALRQGKGVFVQITPRYLGHSQRPAWLHVSWTIDGLTKSQAFRN